MKCILSDVVLITILFYFSSGSEDSVNMITSSGTSPIPLEPPPALPPKMNKSKQVIQHLYIMYTIWHSRQYFENNLFNNIEVYLAYGLSDKIILLSMREFDRFDKCQFQNGSPIHRLYQYNDSRFGLRLVGQNRVTKCSMYVVNISLHNRML